MEEKIVVIGSNSFSGSNFIDYTLSENIKTVGISRSPEPNPVFLPYKKRDLTNFKFYQFDLNKDMDEIIKVVNDFKPDFVVNFASQSMVSQSWHNPDHWFQTNVVSNIMLHDYLRECKFLKKYVHISTPEVYGTCKGLKKESTVYNPSTPYAVSRAATDMSLFTFLNNYNFPVILTRAANIFGPGQQLYRIVPRAILYFLIKKKLQLHGGGKSVRSFIYVSDVSDGTLKAVRRGKKGDIFHFSTDLMISIRDLVCQIADQLGVSFEDNIEIVEDRPGKDAAYMLDCEKARTELNWDCKISLENGIENTIRWVKDNVEVLKKQPFDYIHKK